MFSEDGQSVLLPIAKGLDLKEQGLFGQTCAVGCGHLGEGLSGIMDVLVSTFLPWE
jgi:hypothetical protein